DRLCDRIAFFRHKVIRIDSPDELRAELYGRATEIRLLPAPRPEDLARVRAVAGVREARFENGSIIVASTDPLRTNPLLVRALVEGGAEIAYVTERRARLEDVYLRIVEDVVEGGGAPPRPPPCASPPRPPTPRPPRAPWWPARGAAR